jgi:mono/diheme cytochrome c family protein
MTRPSLLLLACAALGAACHDDVADPPASATDHGSAVCGAGTAQLARGQYLVDSILYCGECHTPRLPDQSGDPTRYLAGISCMADLDPPYDNGRGCISAGNLTSDATGLKNDSDQEIKNVIFDGIRPDGTALHRFMPYYMYHNVSEADQDAVVAYLRSVKPVVARVLPNQPPFDRFPDRPAIFPSMTEMPAVPPMTMDATAAQRGRYLVAIGCIECHTPAAAFDSPAALVMERVLSGGRTYQAATFGLVPPYPELIHSTNLTAGDNGLQGWSASDVRRALIDGIDTGGGRVCVPMPSGRFASFGRLTDADAQDIGAYLTSIPGVAGDPVDNCVVPY